MTSKNNALSLLARNLDATGDVTADAIASTVSLGASVYDSVGLLPYVGNNTGDQAFVSSTNRLYIWQGSGWYSIALINRAPTIASVLDSDNNSGPFALALDGTATTITITAADSDGDPITYSATADSDFNGLATISQADNIFTVTPFSSDSATTESGTITFKATDGVNIASSGVQTFTLNFLSALWDETVLSIGTSSTNSLDNSTFIDRSTNAHTVTTAGTPTQTAFHPYLDYWSVEFTEDTMTIPSSAEFNVGNGDFTFETWINTTRNGGTIFDFGGNYLITYNGFNTTFTSDGYLKMTLNQQSNSDAGQYILTGSTKINDGKWNHIRITRTGTTFRIFVNGALDVSGTSSVTGYQAASAFVIGGSLSNNSATSGLTGHLADFRLIKGTSLNTTDDSFDVPTENLTNVSGTSLLLFNRNRFIDLSSTGHSLTNNGAKVSAFNPFGQESEYTVGENKGSYKNVTLGTDNAYVAPHTSKVLVYDEDWTIEFWCYADTFTTQSYIIGKGILTSRQWAVAVQDSILRFYYSTNGSSSGDTTKDISYDFTTGQWYHIALVNDGATNTLNYYVNGTSIGTQVLGAFFATNGYGEYIGKFMNYGDANHGFNGYISDLKIDNGNKVYTSAFTPPTAPVGNTNADLYLPMDNAGIFDKTGNNTLTLAGNTSTSTTQTKFADTAMYFDGTGDYIELPYDFFNPNTELFQGPIYTLEAWIYQSSAQTGDGGAIFDTRSNGSAGAQLRINTNNSLIFYYTTATPTINGSTNVTNNQWHHIAIVNDGTNITMYLDGNSIGSGSTNTANSSSHPLRIGGDNNTTYFQGYIENFQILKGVAKYTANFTPPTQEQGRTYQAED